MSKIIGISLSLLTVTNLIATTHSLPLRAQEILCNQDAKDLKNKKIKCKAVSETTMKFNRSLDAPLKSLNAPNQFINLMGIPGYPDQRMVRDARLLWKTFEKEMQEQTNTIIK